MTLRMPQNLSTSPRFETGASVLEAEMAAEQASVLGRAGRRAQAAVAALEACAAASGTAERQTRLTDAAEAVWCYFIQREVLGLLDHRAPIALYRIPREVLIRLGVTRSRPAATGQLT